MEARPRRRKPLPDKDLRRFGKNPNHNNSGVLSIGKPLIKCKKIVPLPYPKREKNPTPT